ncbi:hypothetical protein [Streptomyces sp. NPDC002952]
MTNRWPEPAPLEKAMQRIGVRMEHAIKAELRRLMRQSSKSPSRISHNG